MGKIIESTIAEPILAIVEGSVVAVVEGVIGAVVSILDF